MRLFFSILMLCLLLSFAPSETDYRKVFGKDYTWALNWIKQNEKSIDHYTRIFDVPAMELKAIVFPELIRYNGVFNAIEVESLKYLYVMEGKTYADFSVGYFQMKPSFVEMLEQDAKLLKIDSKFRPEWAEGRQVSENEDTRKARVKRLCNTEQQLIYLCMFYKVCQARFAYRHFSSAKDRVRFYATCYNAGYQRSESDLLSFQEKKYFYNHNYSTVSAFYFMHER